MAIQVIGSLLLLIPVSLLLAAIGVTGVWCVAGERRWPEPGVLRPASGLRAASTRPAPACFYAYLCSSSQPYCYCLSLTVSCHRLRGNITHTIAVNGRVPGRSFAILRVQGVGAFGEGYGVCSTRGARLCQQPSRASLIGACDRSDIQRRVLRHRGVQRVTDRSPERDACESRYLDETVSFRSACLKS